MDRLRVLIADDNRDAADSLRVLLELLDYEVRVAYDGSAAVSEAEEWMPHVAVLDLDMPVMNGFATAQALRDRHPAILLVVLSGYLDEENIARARLAGVEMTAGKGIAFREFRTNLEWLVERRLGTSWSGARARP